MKETRRERRELRLTISCETHKGFDETLKYSLSALKQMLDKGVHPGVLNISKTDGDFGSFLIELTEGNPDIRSLIETLEGEGFHELSVSQNRSDSTSYTMKHKSKNMTASFDSASLKVNYMDWDKKPTVMMGDEEL